MGCIVNEVENNIIKEIENESMENNFIENVNDKKILGYCPTMYPFAIKIQNKNENIKLRLYGSTFESLNALKNKEVDFILVGRIIKKNELDIPFELRLENRLTLISNKRRIIQEEDLKNLKIHTYLDTKIVKNYFLNLENIVFYETFNETIEKGLDQAVLINWDDFKDDFELIIPYDVFKNKVEKFRLPIIYSFDEKLLNNLIY